MRTTSIYFLAILLAIFSLNVQAQELQPNESKISWTGKAAFNSYSLTGTLTPKKGQITIENNTILSMTIVVGMKSLDHDNNDLTSHLKSKDFFEVNTYKTASFKLTSPAQIKNGKAMVIGNMTIKNVEHEESIELTISGNTITFSHTMDRTIYGIKFNSPSFFKKMKENAIADDFILAGSLFFK